MRRWLSLGVAILLLFGGCGFRPGSQRAAQKLLDALQDGNLSRAEDFVKDGALSFDGRTRKAKRFYKAMFATLSYTVVETAEEGASASVTVAVTAVNMELLAAAESFGFLDSALAGEKLDGEGFYETITETIESGSPEYITTVVAVAVEDTEVGWRVDLAASPAFADAITGGLGELIQ